MIIHTVQKGESLWQLANRYGVGVSQIVEINQLPNPDQLLVGQALIIPTYNANHVVKSGETLWMISNQYEVPMDAIIAANRIQNPSLIYPGTVLAIPPIRYKVQPGDTIGQIADRYGTTVEEIIRMNQIQNPNILYVNSNLIIPRRKPSIETNAFTYQSGVEAEESIGGVAQYLTYLAMFAYVIQADGSLELYMNNDVDAIQAGLSKGALPMMSITNFTVNEAGENIAHAVLSNEENRQQLLNNILSILKEKGYRGLNVDFENVLPDDRQLYNQFLQLLVDTLHQEGYFVSTSLAPKVSGEQKGLLYEAHDYAFHGKVADFVVLMTYEWGYRKGPPQPISPLNEIKRVLDYAVSVIPSEKILMGFQLYARDWAIPHVEGQEAETLSPQEAITRATKYGASIQYDPIAQSPYFQYTGEEGGRHEVWFEDARSAQAKFNTVKEYNLRGVSYWVLGYPFPQNWVLLEDNFNIIKL